MSESYLQETVFSRGWRDTIEYWSDWRFWRAEVFGGGSIAIVWGAEAALVAIALLAAAIWIVATVMAPFRQRDEVRAALMDAKETVKALQDGGPEFSCQIEEFILSFDDANEGVLVAIVTVSNIGKSQSALTTSNLSILEGETEVRLRNVHIDALSLKVSGQQRVLRAENTIYEKGVSPIPSGGFIRGHIVAAIPAKERQSVKAGSARVKFSCEDIHKRKYTCLDHRNPEIDGPQYFPGSGVELG